MIDTLRDLGFDVLTRNHAEAILAVDFPDETAELVAALSGFRIPADEIVGSGGGEARSTQRLRRGLAEAGWRKHRFEMALTVDGRVKEAITHEIDHVRWGKRGTLALEIEWNNKDPFFDRDLENFKRLHADGVISIGAIVTRGASLQESLREFVAQFARDRGINSVDALADYYTPTQRQIEMIGRAAESRGSFEDGWAHAFVSDKFGEATTHWRKLADRVQRGVGNPCPLLLIGIPRTVVVA